MTLKANTKYKINKAYSLLVVLVHYTDNKEESDHVNSLYNKMVDEGVPDSMIEKNLIGMLYDGINNGNWPWVKYDRN